MHRGPRPCARAALPALHLPGLKIEVARRDAHGGGVACARRCRCWPRPACARSSDCAAACVSTPFLHHGLGLRGHALAVEGTGGERCPSRSGSSISVTHSAAIALALAALQQGNALLRRFRRRTRRSNASAAGRTRRSGEAHQHGHLARRHARGVQAGQRRFRAASAATSVQSKPSSGSNVRSDSPSRC